MFGMVSLGLFRFLFLRLVRLLVIRRVSFSAARAARGAERKRSRENGNDDSPEVAHLALSFVGAKCILATRADTGFTCSMYRRHRLWSTGAIRVGKRVDSGLDDSAPAASMMPGESRSRNVLVIGRTTVLRGALKGE